MQIIYCSERNSMDWRLRFWSKSMGGLEIRTCEYSVVLIKVVCCFCGCILFSPKYRWQEFRYGIHQDIHDEGIFIGLLYMNFETLLQLCHRLSWGKNGSDVSLRRLVMHRIDPHWFSYGRLSYVCQLWMGWLSLVQLIW